MWRPLRPTSKKHTGKVLVLGGDDRSTLATIRSLGRARITVHLSSFAEGSVVSYSRYVSRKFQISQFTAIDNWLDALNTLVLHEQYDLVIPCTDPVIIPLQTNRHSLIEPFRYYLISEFAFRTFQNKIASHELATQLGIPTPRSRYIKSISALADWVHIFAFPVVVKPVSSFDDNHLLQKAYVEKANDHLEFEELVRKKLTRGPVLVQENVVGCGVGVEVLCKDGVVLFAFQHERVHEPPGGGGSSYRKSVCLHPGMLKAARQLMESVSYTGVAMVEFILNPTDGQWVFLEVNARFWGSLPLAIAAGADFPRYLYELCVAGRSYFPQQYEEGRYCRHLRRDFQWLISKLRSTAPQPELQRRNWYQILGEAGNILLRKEDWDTFALDDLRPALVDIGNISREISSKIVATCLPNLEMPMLVRQMRRRAWKTRLLECENILFVCKGNICRSPFAENYAARLFSKWNVSSAGYYPVSGRLSPPDAVNCARDHGIDLTQHRSRVLDARMIEMADAILVFDKENYQFLVTNFSNARNRVSFLGEYDNSNGRIIEDPFGYGSDTFGTVYKKIARCLESIHGDLGRGNSKPC